MNTITVKPSEEVSGYAEATFASFDQFRVEAALGGPFSESVRGRFSFMTNQQGEIYKNQYTATTEVRNATGEPVDVILSVNDPLNCDVIQAGACIDGNGDGSATRPVVGGDFSGNTDPDGSGPKTNKDFAFDDQNEIESFGLLAELGGFGRPLECRCIRG